jgi:hypothetical protein
MIKENLWYYFLWLSLNLTKLFLKFILHIVHTGSGAHPSSYAMSTGGKAAGS